MERFLLRLTSDNPQCLTSHPRPIRQNGRDVFWRGYIANRGELERRADRSFRHPRLESSAELFARADEWWGPDLPRHVLGEYAAAIYDRERRTLLLAHDELGLIPLFYSESRAGVVVGTDLADVVGATGVGELDEEYVADYLTEGWHLGERTPYTHIRRLLPGQSIVWQQGRLTQHETWTLDEIEPPQYRDHREYEERLRQLLAEAITAAIPPGGKVLCELSGGLDSSTILAFSAGSGAGSVEAFSFVYPESHSADERPWIEAILEKYPVPWHSIDADRVRPFSEIPDGFCGEPNLLLVNAARQRSYRRLLETMGADVVLTGVGGDAALVGDAPEPYYLADLLREFRWGSLWDEVLSWSRASEQRRPPAYWLARYAVRPLARRARQLPLGGADLRIPWISEHYADKASVTRRGRAAHAPRFRSAGDSWYFERVLRGANNVATNYRGTGMPCPFRHPLLYRPLLTFMCGVPWHIKLHPQCDRLLQRRALEDVLPGRVLRRRSKLGPDQAFYTGLEASPEWHECLTANPQIVERGYADPDKWRSAVQQARLGGTVGLRYLLASATLEIWLQQLDSRRHFNTS